MSKKSLSPKEKEAILNILDEAEREYEERDSFKFNTDSNQILNERSKSIWTDWDNIITSPDIKDNKPINFSTPPSVPLNESNTPLTTGSPISSPISSAISSPISSSKRKSSSKKLPKPNQAPEIPKDQSADQLVSSVNSL